MPKFDLETTRWLEKLWLDLSSDPELLESIPVEEVQEELREMGIDPAPLIESIKKMVREAAENSPLPFSRDVVEEQVSGRFLLDSDCYKLRAAEGDPTLLRVENLPFIKLRKKREQDLRKPGSCKVQIEHAGKTLVIPISEFVDVGERLSYKLAATDSSSRTDSAAEESTAPLLKYRCEIEPCCVEVFVDENGFVYLRLEEIR